MRKRNTIDDALHELAKGRDKLLGARPTFSPARQAALIRILARQFPVEAALREVVTKRDQSLNLQPSGLPAPLESILRHQLKTAFQPATSHLGPRKLDGLKPSSFLAHKFRRHAAFCDLASRRLVWLSVMRSRFGLLFAACAVVVVAVLVLSSGWENPSRRNEALSETPRGDELNMEWGTELFSPKISIGPFNLNTSQPASLQASFVAHRDIRFFDGIDSTLGLRLDLPVRVFLSENNLARIP